MAHSIYTSEAGVGELHTPDGRTLLSNVRYELTIGHAEVLGGLPVITGMLEQQRAGELSSLGGADVVLRLEDGRQWECVLAGDGALGPRHA